MIVPISKGASSAPAAMGPVPSETNMLMALAIMHKNGLFDDNKKSSTPKLPPSIPAGGER